MTELNKDFTLNRNAKEVKVKRTRKTVLRADTPAVRATSEQVGDKEKPQIAVPTIVAMPLDTVSTQNLKVANHPSNHSQLSGKKLGAALYDTVAKSIVIALGSGNTDNWMSQTDATQLTPVGALPSMGHIGDLRRRAQNAPITSLSIPVVSARDLAEQSSPINNSALSGKKLGSMVIAAETGIIYVALGDKDVDVWSAQNGSDVTPAGGAMPNLTSSKVGDSNRKVHKQPAVACVDIPVVAYTDVSTKASVLNAHSELSGKQLGAMVFIKDGAGTGSIAISQGSADVSVWHLQKDNSDVTPA